MLSPQYRTLSSYLKERFGEAVQRVSLEGGFTCPNRDGTKASGGCTFCTDEGSSSLAQSASDSIKVQLEQGIRDQGKRFGVKKFIAYFQSFTNTYAPVDELRQLYKQATAHPQVVVLAIGTRPDCVPEEVLDLFEEFASPELELWVDIGVQTAHNKTQELINRAHTWEDFTDAVKRIRARKNPHIKICTHVILGLPSETKEMMLETAEKIAEQKIDHLKIHQLCIFKGTAMEIDYLNGDLKVFEEQEYIELLAEFLKRLPKDLVIQRLLGEGPRDELVAPDWAMSGKKQGFLSRLNKYLQQDSGMTRSDVVVSSRGA